MERTKNKYTDKFEFILRINDNIICQRYFNIRGYNNRAKESMERRFSKVIYNRKQKIFFG